MEMSGEQHIPLPQQRVWEALNDPAILKACIPGCESIDRVAENEYKVAMTAAIGPVKAKFAGKLLLADINPPNSYSLAFEGSGGAAGFGKGSAQVSLAPEGGGTLLTYKATASVGGKLAQIGSRLIDGVAKKMSDDFFIRFNKTVAPAVAAAGEPLAPSPASGARVPVWVWIGGAIVILLIVLYLAR
ncbi:MAG TPA: carbon monoxide dehydrogenase subunit G [Burkholderiales bacterium]|nr:carbon monoxide dehydrogenase subunit G [Burkholderiales bacterium]